MLACHLETLYLGPRRSGSVLKAEGAGKAIAALTGREGTAEGAGEGRLGKEKWKKI